MKTWKCKCGCSEILETSTEVTTFKWFRISETGDIELFDADFSKNGQTWYQCHECGLILPVNSYSELLEFLDNSEGD